MSNEDLTLVLVGQARIEERLEANTHRIRNIDMKLDSLDAKIELRPCKEDITAIIGPLKERVDSIEKTQTWIVRSALAGVALVGSGLVAIGKKFGVT